MRQLAFIATPIMDFDEHGNWIPTMQDADRESPQLGVFLLAGALRRDGWQVTIIDWVANPSWSPDSVATQVAEFSVALFSANSMNWASALAVCRKAVVINPRLQTCIGGPHPTHYPESVVRSQAYTAYFRGEADAFVSIIAESLYSRTRPPFCVPGLGWTADSIAGIPATHTERELDSLEWTPAYDSLPDSTYLVLPTETSRGCKFQCSFCSIPQKKNWRAYSKSVGVRNLELAYDYISKSKTGIISVVDDTFTTDHRRIQELCDHLDPNRFNGRLMYDATLVDARNVDVVSALAPFTSDLLLGAEVSSKDDGKRIKKASNPRLIIEAAETLLRFDIAKKAVFSFIIGFPWHTKEDCLRTVMLAKNLAMDFGTRIYIQWYWPMPGSEIWNSLVANKQVSIEMMDAPGFFRRQEWFFPIRQITIDDMRDIDDRILAVQGVLDLYSGSRRYRPIEYGSPLKMWKSQRINRNPSLVLAGDAHDIASEA